MQLWGDSLHVQGSRGFLSAQLVQAGAGSVDRVPLMSQRLSCSHTDTLVPGAPCPLRQASVILFIQERQGAEARRGGGLPRNTQRTRERQGLRPTLVPLL